MIFFSPPNALFQLLNALFLKGLFVCPCIISHELLKVRMRS